MQIACVAESSLWTLFLEASVEDMLPTAYVDAHTTTFYFFKLFLVVPLSCVKKLLRRIRRNGCSFAKQCLGRDTLTFGTLVGLLLLHFQCHLATIKLLTRGLSWQPDWAWFWLCACVGTKGNCSWSVQPCGPNFARSSTSGSLGAILTVDERHVAMTLTWPWWSLKGSRACGPRRIGH